MNFQCKCGAFVSTETLSPRPDGYFVLMYHNRPDGINCMENRLVVPSNQNTGFLDPEGTHVGDKLGDEIVIAYGHYDDETQAVITLMPRDKQQPSPLRPTWNVDYATMPFRADAVPSHSNYCTFYMGKDRRRHEVQYHSNIAFAVQRYTEDMGMDV